MHAKPTILVVDEDPRELGTIVAMLGWEQYDVIGAEDCDAATRHLAMPVDLVIGDLQLEKPDTSDFLRLCREQRPAVPFVLVSDAANVESTSEALRFGVTDIILKPVHAEELRVRIAKCLAEAQQEVHTQPFETQLGGLTGMNVAGSNGIRIPPGTTLEELERAAVERALEEHHGNRTHAARVLGISVRTLQRKLKAWRIPCRSGDNHLSPPRHFLHAGPVSPAFATHSPHY
jgi:DNA-binding NtrC family response regulator